MRRTQLLGLETRLSGAYGAHGYVPHDDSATTPEEAFALVEATQDARDLARP